MSNRTFDVVVFGATGFTGAMCAEYLLRTYGSGNDALKWAISGRSESKLKQVKKKLGKIVGDAEAADGISTIVADVKDFDSMCNMCSQTKVVISTVGPFINFGEALIKACLEQETEYVDSTGETPFIRMMIDKYQNEAEEKGLRLVPSCGYDSIPSDLSVYKLVQFVKENDEGASIGDVKNYIGPFSGGTSGGTIASMGEILGLKDKKFLAKVMGNPFSLAPGAKKNGMKKGVNSQRGLVYDDRSKVWTSPWVMASANEKVVVRSAAINGYGPNFTFVEVAAFKSVFKALSMTIFMTLGMLAMMIGPIRSLLFKYVLPSSGEGPSRTEMDRGYAVSTAVTTVGDTSYKAECHILGGDCGYKSTGMMLAESGIALAKSKETVGTSSGGFHTTATAPGMQDNLVEALENNCKIFFKASKGSSVPTMDSSIKKVLKQYK